MQQTRGQQHYSTLVYASEVELGARRVEGRRVVPAQHGDDETHSTGRPDERLYGRHRRCWATERVSMAFPYAQSTLSGCLPRREEEEKEKGARARASRASPAHPRACRCLRWPRPPVGRASSLLSRMLMPRSEPKKGFGCRGP